VTPAEYLALIGVLNVMEDSLIFIVAFVGLANILLALAYVELRQIRKQVTE
jgi:hypothetical protein